MAKRRRRGARRRIQRMDIEWYGDAFVDILSEHGDEALFLAGRLLQEEAARRAPRRTGQLAGSGYVSTAKRSTYRKRPYWRREKKPPRGGATVGFTAPHAHLMESGRRRRGEIRPGRNRRALLINGQLRSRSRYNRMSSRPFLGPALEASRESLVRELAALLGKKLEQELG